MSSNRQPTGSHISTNKSKTTNQKNKQLSPLIISKTLINQTGSYSPSDFSDNENDWQTVTNDSGKRQISPNTPSSPHSKKDTSIFISSNRFSPLAPPNEESQMDTDNIEQLQEVTLPKTANPPPIFIEANLNFNNFTAKIKELTQPAGFEYKTLDLYFKDNVVSMDHSQDEHIVVNNKINKIEDIQNDSFKLQKLLDSDTQEKVNKKIQQISEETDVEYIRPKSIILAQLIIKAISLLENSGVKVDGIVSDGAQTNRRLWTELGVSGSINNVKNSFQNPMDE
ncbi:hypothetical protein ACI65C_004953 [Semiaphis heraclei]